MRVCAYVCALLVRQRDCVKHDARALDGVTALSQVERPIPSVTQRYYMEGRDEVRLPHCVHRRSFHIREIKPRQKTTANERLVQPLDGLLMIPLI